MGKKSFGEPWTHRDRRLLKNSITGLIATGIANQTVHRSAADKENHLPACRSPDRCHQKTTGPAPRFYRYRSVDNRKKAPKPRSDGPNRGLMANCYKVDRHGTRRRRDSIPSFRQTKPKRGAIQPKTAVETAFDREKFDFDE